jgi:YD repeat-containing protein
MWALDIAGATSAGMLVAIDNGMGKVTNFGYSASAQLAAAAQAAGDEWVRSLPISIPVPVRTEVDLADGEPARVVELSVRDGFWDYTERRFGGFGTATRHFPDAGGGERWELTTYHLGLGNNRELRGKPLTVATYANALSPASLMTMEVNTYQALSIDGMPDLPLVKLPVKTSTRLTNYEKVATKLVSGTDYIYDSAGHLTRENRLGRLDLTGDEQTIVKSYASNETLWVRDVVIEEQLLDGSGNVLSDRKSLFGDNSVELAFGQVGKGWLREVDQLLVYGNDNRWVPVQQIAYDAMGQPLTIVEHGVTHTLGYDALDLHPISESVTPQPGTTLTWRMAWDATLDLPTDLTDPNGQTQHVNYDALGRTASFALAGKPAHTVFTYAWTAPAPRTITYQFDGAVQA